MRVLFSSLLTLKAGFVLCVTFYWELFTVDRHCNELYCWLSLYAKSR
jgi:hypothetical protein